MLTIIDRYIAKYFVGYFLAGLIVFIVIFLAADFMSAYARWETSTETLFRYYGYYLPEVLYQMIPVACLVGGVFTLSTLNKSNELTALFSLGMSLARISAPILVIVALVSVLSFWLSDRVLPGFAQKKNYVYYVEIRNKPHLYSTVKRNKIWYRSENILFNIRALIPEKHKAFGISLYYFDSDWNLAQLVNASSVLMKGQNWLLRDGSVTLFTEESSFPLTRRFSEKNIIMDEDIADIQTTAHSSDIMSLGQLRRFIQKNKEAGLETLRYEVEYYSKFSFAFAAFVMSLIGIPFSVGSQRSGGRFLSVGICVGFAFLYWISMSAATTMGKHGYIPALLAAWLPNLIIAFISVFFLVRLKK